MSIRSALQAAASQSHDKIWVSLGEGRWPIYRTEGRRPLSGSARGKERVTGYEGRHGPDGPVLQDGKKRADVIEEQLVRLDGALVDAEASTMPISYEGKRVG